RPVGAPAPCPAGLPPARRQRLRPAGRRRPWRRCECCRTARFSGLGLPPGGRLENRLAGRGRHWPADRPWAVGERYVTVGDQPVRAVLPAHQAVVVLQGGLGSAAPSCRWLVAVEPA